MNTDFLSKQTIPTWKINKRHIEIKRIKKRVPIQEQLPHIERKGDKRSSITSSNKRWKAVENYDCSCLEVIWHTERRRKHIDEFEQIDGETSQAKTKSGWYKSNYHGEQKRHKCMWRAMFAEALKRHSTWREKENPLDLSFSSYSWICVDKTKLSKYYELSRDKHFIRCFRKNKI